MNLTKRIAIALLVVMSAWCANGQQPGAGLQYFLDKARHNSALLNDLSNQQKSLKTDSLKLLADYGFKVNSVTDLLYAPVIKGWGYDDPITNGQNISTAIRVSRDLIGSENRGVRMADFRLSANQVLNKQKMTEMQLSKSVTEQYIATYALQQLYNNSTELLHMLQHEDSVLRKLTQHAGFKQTDYLSFLVTVQQNVLASEQLHADRDNNFAMLNFLCGIADSTVRKLDAPLIEGSAPADYDRSVYAQTYRADSLKLLNDAKLLGMDYRPKLSVFADAGFLSTLTLDPYKNIGASVGLSLVVPLYDGGKLKKSLQQNELLRNTRTQYKEQEKKQYDQEKNRLMSQIKHYKQLSATAKTQLNYAQTLIDAHLRLLPTGDVKVSDFILAINNYIGLKSGLIQYEATLYNLYNRVNNLTVQ